MSMFTRTRRGTAAPAPNPAPVVAYSNPSASIAVWEGRRTWELVIRAENRSDGPAMGQFTFDNRKCAVTAAQWLAYQNLTGIGTNVGPGLGWVEFVDAINDRREADWAAEPPDNPPDLPVTSMIQTGVYEVARGYFPQCCPERIRGVPNDERLLRIARLYKVAATVGQPPRKTVADVYRVSISTAGRWITLARGKGLLTERDIATGGRPSGQTRKDAR